MGRANRPLCAWRWGREAPNATVLPFLAPLFLAYDGAAVEHKVLTLFDGDIGLAGEIVVGDDFILPA